MVALWVIIGIIVLAVLWAIVAYNGFVRLNTRVSEAWADIDVQLKRRYDLIPNLIESVKGYAAHEKETLDAVIQARSAATQVHVDPGNINTQSLQKMAQAESGLSGMLGKLFALSENYPDLKANTNFLELQQELSDTENKIQASRRFYNTNVRDLNIKTQVFPSNIIARVFNFMAKEFFELEEGSTEKEPVQVKF